MPKQKKRYKKGREKEKSICLIVNLVLSIIAISFLISLTNVEIVSAQQEIRTKVSDSNEIGEWDSHKIIDGSDYFYKENKLVGVYDSEGRWWKVIQTTGDPSKVVEISTVNTPTGTSSAVDAMKGLKLTVINDKAKGFELIPKEGGSSIKIEDPSKLTNAVLNPDGTGSMIYNDVKYTNIPKSEMKKLFDIGALEKPQGSSMLSQFFGAAGGSGWDALLTGAEYAGLGWGAGQMIGGMVGMDEEEKKALSAALSTGAFTIKSLLTLKSGPAFELLSKFPGNFMLQHAYITGIIVGAIVYAIMYKKESKEVVSFTCKPWQAPVGGGDCEKCNDETGVCNEYRCRSLGQACQLLNVGSKQEKCAWVNPKDTKSPGISPWEDVLTEGYKYTDIRIRPPGEGSEPGRMRIIKTGAKDGCVEAFTPLEFGIVTVGPDGLSEPAQCKIDYNHTLKFDDMAFFFGESNLYLYNHSQKLRLPGPSAINAQAPELQNDGTYTLYVRCRDANGNENVDEFAIRFCVEKGPDTTPPKIEGTSIGNNMPVKYNQTSVELEVYVNEPSECKWSKEDRSYSNMEYDMACSKNVWEMNNNMVYTCKTTLTGLKNRQNNVFYFRCKDQPWANESERNVNMESYKFTLVGTEPLNIIDVKPNGTVYGSTDVVSVNIEVETANGYKNGEAVCSYSETGNENDFIEFFETGTELHKQRLDLVEGSYKYYIKCLDLGGNRDDNATEFKVEVDREAPKITRVYRENELLKIITNEDSECRYDIKSCNFKFEDGIDMPYANQTSHVAEWKTENTYFIRCSDKYGNMPLPNTCSIIVRPYDVVEQKSEE